MITFLYRYKSLDPNIEVDYTMLPPELGITYLKGEVEKGEPKLSFYNELQEEVFTLPYFENGQPLEWYYY